MPWVVKFENDTEVESIGTAVATYTDEQGRQLVIYKDRIDFSAKSGLSNFVAKAKDVLASTLNKKTKVQSIEDNLTTQMNEV